MSNIKCTKCGGDTKVFNTRQIHRENAIMRRRKCKTCGLRVTTAEYVVGESAQGTRVNSLAGAIHLSKAPETLKPAIDLIEQGVSHLRKIGALV